MTAAVTPARSRPPRIASRVWAVLLLSVAIGIAVVGLVGGAEYYRLPLAERPFSALYDLLRPAGSIGLRYGIVGLACITAGVALYTARKRIRALARAGRLKYWLEFHIFLCTVGPFLITLHTSFKVGGLVSIAFWSMAIVALSGIFGRYVYVRIPKTMAGGFADLAAIRRQREELREALGADLGPQLAEVDRIVGVARPATDTGLLAAIGAAVRFDLSRHATLRRVRAALAPAKLPTAQREHALRLIARQLQLEHELAHLLPFQRLFRYWHVLHLPLALAMFLIVGVHVVVATLFGFGFTA